MTMLSEHTLSQLRERQIACETLDEGTILLKGVPLDPEKFNKGKSNLLLARPAAKAAYLVWLDEDLVYRGKGSLARDFAMACCREGWKGPVMRAASARLKTPDEAIQTVLTALGGLGGGSAEYYREDHPADVFDSNLLATYACDMSDAIRNGRGPATLVQHEEGALDVASSLLDGQQARLLLLSGPSGVGKSHLLWGAARRLARVCESVRLISVSLAPLFAGASPLERASLLGALLQEVGEEPGMALALENVELTLNVPDGALLLAHALERGMPVAAPLLPGYVALFQRLPPLARYIRVVRVNEPDRETTLRIALAHRDALTARYEVEVDDAVVAFALEAASRMSGHFPAKAVDLISAAMTRARLRGSDSIGPEDILDAERRLNLMQHDE